jgi:hypothetical protein
LVMTTAANDQKNPSPTSPFSCVSHMSVDLIPPLYPGYPLPSPPSLPHISTSSYGDGMGKPWQQHRVDCRGTGGHMKGRGRAHES